MGRIKFFYNSKFDFTVKIFGNKHCRYSGVLCIMISFTVAAIKHFKYDSTELDYAELLSLALKAPTTTAADDIHKYFFIIFQKK